VRNPELSLGGAAGLAGELAEQLRAVLEPTRASRLAGDFRTGKRLAMRKVIAYIASHFRKDKIWLRRTRPDQRTYQARTAGSRPGSHEPPAWRPPGARCPQGQGLGAAGPGTA